MDKPTTRRASVSVDFTLEYDKPVMMSMQALRTQIQVMLSRPITWANGDVNFTLKDPGVIIIDRRNEAPDFKDMDDVPF